MVTVAELTAKLDVKDGGAAKKLKGFSLSLTDIKAGLELAAGAAKFAANAIRSFTTDIANEGDVLAKAAKNLGINVVALQEFEFAAKLSGVGLDDVRTAVQRMQKGLNDARQKGTGPFADALKQINLTVEEFENLGPDQQFTKLADSLSRVEDATTRAALAQDFFGRGGKTLLPLLNEGAKGINRMRKEFRELGGGFTEDGAAAAEEFVDEMLRMETVLDSVKIAIGVELLPFLQDIITEFKDWALANRDVIRAKLLEFVRKLIKAVKDFLPTLNKLVNQLLGSVPTIIEIVKGIGDFTEAIGGLEAVLKIAAGAWLGFQLATTAALGPVGLIAGAFAFLLPLALELGDLLGDVALEIAGVTAEAERLDKLAGGRASVRGTTRKALETTSERVAGTSVLERRISEMSESQLSGLQEDRSVTPFSKGLIKKEQTKRLRKKIVSDSLSRSRNFTEQQRQIAVLRDEVKGDKRLTKELDKLSQDVSLGKITAAQARSRLGRSTAKKGKRGGGKKRGKGAEIGQKDSTFEDLLTADSLRKRVAEGQVTPTILITVTNFNITQSIDAPVNIQGLSSTTANEVVAIIQRQFDEMLENSVRRGVQDVESRVVR